MTQKTIYLPDQLAEALEGHPEINVSRTCQEALRTAVSYHEIVANYAPDWWRSAIGTDDYRDLIRLLVWSMSQATEAAALPVGKDLELVLPKIAFGLALDVGSFPADWLDRLTVAGVVSIGETSVESGVSVTSYRFNVARS